MLDDAHSFFLFLRSFGAGFIAVRAGTELKIQGDCEHFNSKEWYLAKDK